MSDEYNNTSRQETYENLMQASQEVGKQLEDMLTQVQQYQAECEKNRQELNRLKEDYERDREKNKELIQEILQKHLTELEHKITESVTSAIREKTEGSDS